MNQSHPSSDASDRTARPGGSQFIHAGMAVIQPKTNEDSVMAGDMTKNNGGKETTERAACTFRNRAGDCEIRNPVS